LKGIEIMKKQIVTACALIASVAAFATSVTSENTFGVLKLADTTTSELIIGVPWVSVGTGNVSPTNLVLAANLSNGDMLYMYDATAKGYKVWVVQSGAWTGATTYSIGNKDDYTSISKTGAEALARGEALILKRTGATPYPVVYLSGQYTDVNAGRIQIKNPTASDVPMQVYFTLIANPKTTDVDVNQCKFYTSAEDSTEVSIFGNGTLDDYILLSDGSKYGYDATGSNNKHWYKLVSGESKTVTIGNEQITTTVTTKSYENVIIPVGKGAWYVRAGRSAIYLEWQFKERKMKKILVVVSILLATIAVKAEYLNWQVGTSVTFNGTTYKSGTDYNYVRMYASNDNNSSHTYGIFEAPGTYSTQVQSGYDSTGTSYYIELLNYSSDSYAHVATSSATTYSELSGALSSGALSAQGMTAIWTGTSVVTTPEPTSGLLMLMGFAMLGLKRKKEV